MCWHGSASGKRGRSRKYSEAAIQFCLTVKGLFNLALRQAVGMAQSLLKLAGLDWQAADFCTVTIADAILDRIMQRNHRFTLTGDSLRAQR